MTELLNNITKMIWKMIITPNWRERPTSGHLLSTRREWMLDRNKLKEWTEFESFVEKLCENENKFFEKKIFSIIKNYSEKHYFSQKIR